MTSAPSVAPDSSVPAAAPPPPPSSSLPQPAATSTKSAAQASSSAMKRFLLMCAPSSVGSSDFSSCVLLPSHEASRRKGPVDPRSTTSSGSRRPSTGSPDIARNNSSAPRAPLPSRGWAIVVSPAYAASSTSSNPMTDNCSGTGTPAASAASIAPIATVSEPAKIAVGGSASASSSAMA